MTLLENIMCFPILCNICLISANSDFLWKSKDLIE